MDNKDYTLIEYEKNMSSFSKIRRLFFPTSWDEFVLRPVLSMIQFGAISCILVFAFYFLMSKTNKDHTAIISPSFCHQEIKETSSRLASVEFTLFQIGKKIKKSNNTDLIEELKSLTEENKNLQTENSQNDFLCNDSPENALTKTKTISDKLVTIKSKIKTLKKTI